MLCPAGKTAGADSVYLSHAGRLSKSACHCALETRHRFALNGDAKRGSPIDHMMHLRSGEVDESDSISAPTGGIDVLLEGAADRVGPSGAVSASSDPHPVEQRGGSTFVHR